jgi:hypothetical protein
MAVNERFHLLLVPLAVLAAVALNFFATVAASAALAVLGDGDKSKTAKKPSMLFRASRLASPATSAFISLGVGTTAAFHVTAAAATAGVFKATSCAAASAAAGRLADSLLAVHTPVADNQIAMVVVAVVVGLGALRLFDVAAALNSATPGVTASSHNTHVLGTAAMLVVCSMALYKVGPGSQTLKPKA